MARLARYTIKNQPQHIIQRGLNDQFIFHEEQDYQYFHDCLDAAAFNYDLKVHAYALMPNHVHILATPKHEHSISRTVQSVGRNYVQYFNESYDSTGTLWEGRYRATVIDSSDYMLLCYKYMESDPVRSGLVEKAEEYRWSSYNHNALAQVDEMISPHREYLNLGAGAKSRARAYRKFYKDVINPETIEHITESTVKGWALGNEKFVKKIEKLTGRRASQLPKGRPRIHPID